MFIIETIYLKPMEEVQAFTVEHRAYLQNYFDSGDLLVSGRQNPPTGGLIVVASDDRRKVEEIIAGDPFNREKLTSYRVIEFAPALATKGLKEWLEALKG